MKTFPKLKIAAVIAILFGLLTIKSGGTVLFGPEAARLAAGNIVNFIVWFNFIAGFAYIAAGAGLWAQKTWAISLSGLIALATLLMFAVLGSHIAGGGLFEKRTIGAMTLRLIVWSLIFFFSRRYINKKINL
ncbi:MAG: hypothetical protein GY774_31570 [Planctomycetes bacterium]|nr:hypothetical protein [Planctomycetota bacterium]